MLELYKNIRQRRLALGISQVELARKLGYTNRSSIAKIESGLVDIPHSKIEAFATALQTTPESLMGWEEPANTTARIPDAIPLGFEPLPAMKKVPLVGQIACGEPITAEENLEGYVNAPDSLKVHFALICKGESMAPRIQDGDIVYICKQQNVDNGVIAAVRINNEATLKRVYLHEDYIELRPENPTFESIIRRKDDMNDVHIEGKAVGLYRNI